MIQSLWAGASGMQAQQLKVDAISNNLANVNTPGFKASRVTFQDLMYTDLHQAAPGQSDGGAVSVQVGTGVAPGGITRDLSPGTLEQTGRDWDLAIDGAGFFRVKLGDGTVGYTRNGGFAVSALEDGRLLLADRQGHPLLTDGDGTLEIPAGATRVDVAPDGKVTAHLADGNTQDLGQIKLASFPNPQGLQAIGNNLYKATTASGEGVLEAPGANGLGVVRQGFLEGSNVQVVAELVNLIVAQRAYELNARAVQSSDQMLEIANNLRR